MEIIVSQRHEKNRRYSYKIGLLAASFMVVAACESLLLIDVFADVFHLDIAMTWVDHNVVEVTAVSALGLALAAIGWSAVGLLGERRRQMEALDTAAGQLLHVIAQCFEEWALSPSEREIALLLIKGFSLREIANLRETRPGTVKSQTNAVYRKAGVHGRAGLIAYFVEDLLAGAPLAQLARDQQGAVRHPPDGVPL